MQELYHMELHNEIRTREYVILRVPGGWVYTYFAFEQRERSDGSWGEEAINSVSSVFVPFHNEFIEIGKEVR